MRKFKVGDKVKILELYYDSIDKTEYLGRIITWNNACYYGLDYYCLLSTRDHIHASKLKKVAKRPVGRPKGSKNKVNLDTWNVQEVLVDISIPGEVTFKITKLEDGTEVVVIPKEWIQVTDGLPSGELFMRKVKK